MFLCWILFFWWKVLIYGKYICDMKNGCIRMCFYVDIFWIYFLIYIWYELKFKLYIYKIYCIYIWFFIFEKKWLIFFYCNRFCFFIFLFKYYLFGIIKDCFDLWIWFIGRNCINGFWILLKYFWWMEVIFKS